MKDFIKKLIASLDNKTDGFSGRKLSALAAIITGIYITVLELPKDDQLHALYAWLAFALLCLGIITAQQVLEFKDGKKQNPTV